MPANNIIVGIGASIVSTCTLFHFLRLRCRHEPVQWRGGIPMSGISQVLFLGGLISVAVGAMTGAIVFFASIFIITFMLGWLSQARDRISHFRTTGRKIELSRELLYAVLPIITLLMFFTAPLLGRRNVLNLNVNEWFSIAFLVYVLLLVYVCSKPKKPKKSHRMT